MNPLLQNLIPIIVFLAIILVVYGVYLFWVAAQNSGSEQIKNRIRRLSAAAVEESEARKFISLARQEGLSGIDAALLRMPRLHNLDRFLEQAGVRYGPATYVSFCLVAGVAGATASSLFFRAAALLPLAIGFLLGALIPWLFLSRKRHLRRERLIKQIPDTLDFFARSLRAGTPFSGAIKIASEEMPQPIAGELAVTFDELNFGLNFDEALHNLAARVDTEEIRLFVTAVLVQKNTGGNLAELLNRLSKLLRDRITAFGEIKIQAAEMRTTARVLVFLPFIVAAMLQIVNPDYFPLMLESRMGQNIIIIQVVLMAIGYYITNRMVSFRV
ncbi:MAG: type II secretion system F family protein [Gammaproteobacteria bacterium]|nr:type II secretion system F family protein [Pseudomonadales bacterium]MCP5348231.1 type II secretion system F family protein [Pseudomonadales bacterium]